MELRSIRLAILCSFNVDLIRQELLEKLRERGLQGELYLSGYGQWETDAIDPDSKLYAFSPDVVILFADILDLVPMLSVANMVQDGDDGGGAARDAWQRIASVVRQLLETLPADRVIMIHNVVAAPITALGTLESNSGYSYQAAVESFNKKLRELSTQEARLTVVDYLALVTDYGWKGWYDWRLWHLARMRLSREAMSGLATCYTRYLSALYLPRRKCLVLDLDNTLWGGVIGEDGISGIEIGHQGVGLAYREFQMAIVALSQRGVILAICSKNNPDEAMDALANHPNMVLRPENLACSELGWKPKHEGLQRIAQRLNIGLDSLVFWDDSPFEREMVRSQLPSVLVPEVPSEVSNWATNLLALDCFDVLSLTDEDQRRGELYRQQAEREQYSKIAGKRNLDEFYRSLQMLATIREADELVLPRIAQLVQRTNQFNFTTRRYTEAEVRRMQESPDHRVYSLCVKDRFGDLGQVGAAIVRLNLGVWELDTLLVSCRALGRGAEDAFLAFLTLQAQAAGARLVGTFVPTAKNSPVREFLDRLGVDLKKGDSMGYQFSTDPQSVSIPSWISVC
jgi:FkbH-like protein